jgi:hypothetical protein
MNILSSIISSGIGDLIKAVTDVVDRFVQTPDEKAKLQVDLIRLAYEQQAKIVSSTEAYEEELTKRLQADAASDSWLARNIRPLALIYVGAAFSVMAFGDGNVAIGGFHLKIGELYVESFRSFMEYALGFYFGGRTIEKVAGTIGASFGKK